MLLEMFIALKLPALGGLGVAAVRRRIRRGKPVSTELIRRGRGDEGTSDYLNTRFLSRIDPKGVRTIVELGAGDGVDALALADYFKAKVITFECMDEAIPVVRRNLDALGDGLDVTLVPLAVSKKTMPDLKATRFDDWARENAPAIEVDLLCIDAQGTELDALKGMGAHLDRLRYIIAEGESYSLDTGRGTVDQVTAYLKERGFRKVVGEVRRNKSHHDLLFVRDGTKTKNDEKRKKRGKQG